MLASFQLRPRTRVFTFPDGSSALLLSLYGTLDGVPIIVWIPKQYPVTVPYIYLDLNSLTGDLKIQVNQFLDISGQFFLPIFGAWSGQPGSLLQAIHQLLEIWHNYYPLFDATSMNAPPLPAKTNEGLLKIESEVQQLPPKLNHHVPIIDASNNLKPVETGLQQLPPPIPKRPSVPTSSQQVDVNCPISPPFGEYGNFVSSSAGPTLKDESPRIGSQTMIPNSAAEPKQETTFTFELPPDLIDDVTEIKSHSTHNELLHKLYELIDKLAVQDMINLKNYIGSHSFNIDAIFTKYSSHKSYEKDLIERVKHSIAENTTAITHEMKKLDEEMEKAKELENSIDPASIAIPETPAFVQLYNLVARDHALNDAIGTVSQLFHREKISLNIMLRKTRELSFEQFKTRYLISKINDLLD